MYCSLIEEFAPHLARMQISISVALLCLLVFPSDFSGFYQIYYLFLVMEVFIGFNQRGNVIS